MQQKAKRSSNIELCRIVCMLLIIAHHCVVHGGSINMDLCANKYISGVLLPGGKLCFDAFLAISAWFMSSQSFKTERFLKTWMQVFFYSVGFYLLTLPFGRAFSRREFLSSLLPITGNSHGFAAAYLAFYLLLPFLRMVSDRLSKKQAKWLVLLLLYYQVFSQILGSVFKYKQALSSELQLFVMCYFLAYYLRNYPLAITKKPVVMLATVFLIWAIVIGNWLCNAIFFPGHKYLSMFGILCADESSLLFLIGGFALCFFFMNIHIPTSKFINTVAHTTFGILLIHDHNFFRPTLWLQIVKADTWYYSDKFVLRVGFYCCMIFVVCGLIEWVRQQTLERWIFSRKSVLGFCQKCDKLLADVPAESKSA